MLIAFFLSFTIRDSLISYLTWVIVKKSSPKNLSTDSRPTGFLGSSSSQLPSRGSHMRWFHSAFQPSNETITESLLTSSTVQGHQIPSSTTVSALKPTVSGSAIAFPVTRPFSLCDRNRFAINKARQLVWWLCIPLLGYKVVSSVLRKFKGPIAHVSTKTWILMNYTLCPCWSGNGLSHQTWGT